MTLSMYQAAIPPLVNSLRNLVGILSKGETYAEEKKIEPSVLLGSRLYPDMFPLTRQIQIAFHHLKSIFLGSRINLILVEYACNLSSS